MGKMMELTAADGHKLGAYLAEPSGKAKGAIVLIQEIFGVNQHIRKVADGYAADGYKVIAPALFDRVGKDIQLGYGPEDQEKGKATRGQLKWDAVLADVAAAHGAVKDAGKIAIVGYCFGGTVAWLGATRQSFDASVAYYGGNIADFAEEKPKCPTICHNGTEDKGIPMEKVEKVKAARPEVTVYTYEGAGHGFNCDERGSWHESSAKLARQRTLDFLGKHIG